MAIHATFFFSAPVSHAEEDNELVVEANTPEADAEGRGVSRTDIDITDQFSGGEDVASAVPWHRVPRCVGWEDWARGLGSLFGVHVSPCRCGH